MTPLIARLEEAGGRDPALNQQIKLAHAAYLSGGGATKDEVIAACGGNLYAEPRDYTGARDAAHSLIPSGCTYAMGDCGEDDLPWACVTDAQGRDYSGTGATDILALASAALKARESLRARADEGHAP